MDPAQLGRCIFFAIFVSMKRLLLTLILGACVGTGFAQETALPSPDAQSLGMGGLAMTTVGASHTLYHNVAMSAFSDSPLQLSSSFYKRDNSDFYSVTGALAFGQQNRLHAGWRQYLHGKGSSDMAVDAGFSRRIGRHWGVGVVGRYLHLRRPDANADALAVDLSAAWSHPLEQLGRYATLRVGAKAANLGGYLKTGGYELPVSATAGVALDTFLSDAHEITVGVDMGYCFAPSAAKGGYGSVGAEYNLMQLVQLRAGYHYGENSRYSPSYAAVGGGVRFLHLRFDFAYLFAAQSSLLHNTYSFSFGLDF